MSRICFGFLIFSIALGGLRSQQLIDLSIESITWNDISGGSYPLATSGVTEFEFAGWGEIIVNINGVSTVIDEQSNYSNPGLSLVFRVAVDSASFQEFVGFNSQGYLDYITSWLSPNSSVTTLSFSNATGVGHYSVRIPMSGDGTAPMPSAGLGTTQTLHFWAGANADISHDPNGAPGGAGVVLTAQLNLNSAQGTLSAPFGAYVSGIEQNASTNFVLVVGAPQTNNRNVEVTFECETPGIADAFSLGSTVVLLANQVFVEIPINLAFVNLGPTDDTVTITATIAGGGVFATKVLISNLLGVEVGGASFESQPIAGRTWCYWQASGADDTTPPFENCSGCRELNAQGAYGSCPRPEDSEKEWWFGFKCKSSWSSGCYTFTDEISAAIWKAGPSTEVKCMAEKKYWNGNGSQTTSMVPGRRVCCNWIYQSQVVRLVQNCKND